MKRPTLYELLKELLYRVLWCGGVRPNPKPVPHWSIGAGYFVITFNGDWKMQLKDNSPALPVSVGWVDSRGKTAPVQAGSLSVVSSDENLVKVAGDATAGFTVEPGDLTGVDADVNGVIGTATITATADADLGDGVTDVAAVGAVVVVAGDAVLGNLSIGGQPA